MTERKILVVVLEDKEHLQTAISRKMKDLGPGWTIVSAQGSVSTTAIILNQPENFTRTIFLITIVVEKQEVPKELEEPEEIERPLT